MKLKIACIILVFSVLSVISCRENEQSMSSTTEGINEKQFRSLKIMTDSIKQDSINNSDNPPKDPPKTGNHWKIND